MFFSTQENKIRPGRSDILICVGTIVFLLGFGKLSLAEKQEGFQQIHQNGITGVLLNVPLRDVLSQLQENLNVDYVVAKEELDKPVSVELSGENFIEALPKILSSWDYALQTDRHGKVRRIYIVKKSTQEVSQEQGKLVYDETEISPKLNLNQPQVADSDISQVGGSPGIEDGVLDQEEQSSPAISVTSAKLANMLLPTDSAPTSMAIPASALPSMDITPASSLPEMTIIPASVYPPMEIFPVSDEDRRAFGEPSVPAGAGGENQPLP